MGFEEIKYRRLSPADEPFLWDMLYLAIHVPDGSPPPLREIIHSPDLARYVDGWGRPDDGGFLALVGDKPAGAVWLRMLTGENKGYGYVDDDTPELSISVKSEYQGRGIGRELMSRALESAISRYPGVCLSVSRGNAAVRLYESCGFVVVSSDSSTLVMVKRF
jgi:ribosomal protein S18 acetylase RimI-like enzyme